MSTVVTDVYSDIDLQDPPTYYGGFKVAAVERFGAGERALSDPVTGDWQGSTFSLRLSDAAGRTLRQQLASTTDKYWSEPCAVRMTTRANRALLGIPYTVFVGPVVDAQPVPELSWDITLGDIVSRSILTDTALSPWRRIRDSFLSQLSVIHPDLVLDRPEPYIYGEHRRIPNEDDTPTQHGFEWTPIKLGIIELGATDWYVWMVCGHAVFDIPDVTTVDEDGVHTSVTGAEGTDWLIPHYGGYTAQFGGVYEDRRSDTYGNDRRYTLIYGKVGETAPDACWEGTLTLTCLVDGVETIGDGSGTLIVDRLEQYKHWALNNIAHIGADSYQSGAWLTNSTWALIDGDVDVIDEASFDTCSATANERFPFLTPGYIGAAIIGAESADTLSRWIADWNRSCNTRSGWTNQGQYRVVMLAPRTEHLTTSTLYTDAYEILAGSFQIVIRWDWQANRLPFRADPDYQSGGQYRTSESVTHPESVVNNNREILGEVRDYPFAPGIAMSTHLAFIEVYANADPPRLVTFEATVGPDADGDSLGYREIGDYIRYQHYAAVGAPATPRLAMIVRHQVQAGTRKVLVEALDCHDLINYDLPNEFGGVSPGNDTCSTAIEITVLPYSITIDTSGHNDDNSLTTSPPLFPGPGVAYKAAWWKFTPGSNGTITISTAGSAFDTQLALFTGTCGGAWTLIEYSDNDGILDTSLIVTPVSSGVEYHIVAFGYLPTDGGSLTLFVSLA